MKRLLIVIVIVALGVGGYLLYGKYHSAPTDRIVVSGNIELEQVNIAFKTAGRVIERTVDEGDKVTKGEVIARLDKDQLIQQRAREAASLLEAEAALNAARTGLEMQTQSSAADIESHQADLDTSKTHLQELKNGSRPQEIAGAEAAVAAAQSDYDHSKKDWDRAETLHKDDDISTSQYDLARSRLDGSEATLQQAKQHLELLKEGSRREDVDMATAQVMKADAGVKNSQANSLDIKRRQQDVASKEADIAREKAQIALIDAQLADTTATSPIAGVVLVKSVDVGEVIAPGTTVVTVGDISHPWLRAYIKEPDLSRVKLGTPVRVKTDSGKVYDGKISFISSEAEFTPKQIQTTEERVKLVYRVKIDIDNPNGELKSNMPADAEILAKS
jgi:HlyD family secretion protein